MSESVTATFVFTDLVDSTATAARLDLERARDLATTAAATAAEYGCAGLTKRAAALLEGGR